MFGRNDNRKRFVVKDDNQFMTLREEIKDKNDNPITKMEVLGCSINSCIKQDEEFSCLDSYIKSIGLENSWFECYEFRPESFEIRVLSENIPKKITNSLLENKIEHNSSGYCRANHKILNSHSIFYIYNNNEIVFWNWSKEDPVYSVQTEEFYMENSQEKANIRCVGVYECEESAFFLISTETYLILLELIKNSNGNYIINRIRDSFYSLTLNRHKNVKFSCITVHQASGRFFLGCENTGNVFEFEFPPLHGSKVEPRGFGKIIGDTLSNFMDNKIQKISGIFTSSPSSNTKNDNNNSRNHHYNKEQFNSYYYDNQCISKLVCVTKNWFMDKIIPSFVKNIFFGNSEHIVNYIYSDENRGLLYVLYKNSDIDVFNIPIGSIYIKKISDDFTFIERPQIISNMSVSSCYPIRFLFRINFKTLQFELNKLVSNGSDFYPKKQSISEVNSQKNLSNSLNSMLNNFFIHSIHPVNPLESENIVLIIVTSKGDRIYMEAKYDVIPLSTRESSGECITLKLPTGMKVRGFRRSPISGLDESFISQRNDYLISSALYSNGVFIQTVLNKEEDESSALKENNVAFNVGNHYTSSIIATCLDQTMIAKNQMQTSTVFRGNRTSNDGNHSNSDSNNYYGYDDKNNNSVFKEWQYAFSDPNLGVVLDVQERGILSNYQRLFDNLWNVPNPYEFRQYEVSEYIKEKEINNSSSSSNLFFIRHNLNSLVFDNLTSNKTGFGAKTSGSKFYHIWKYFYNRISSLGSTNSFLSKSDLKNNSNDNIIKLKTFDLIQKELNLNKSSCFLNISFPGLPHSGLKDIVLDQTTQNRSWTVITTNGVFLLEKKKILDIITNMTLEPHNYSFMLNIFDDFDKYGFSDLNRDGENTTDLLHYQNKSVTFVMRLLGTFAHTVTFEQFFSVIWQGLINLNIKGIFNNDVFQRMHSSTDGIKSDSPMIEIYMKNNNNNTIINQRHDFPLINLIRIWVTLISDISIQSRSIYSSYCNVKLNSLNCSISISPRCKGLILLISRILRSIWGTPLFQQTDFEIKSSKFALKGCVGEFKDDKLSLDSVLDVQLNKYLINKEKNSVIGGFNGYLDNDNNTRKGSKIVNELIKNQIDEFEVGNSGNKRRINSVYANDGKNSKFNFSSESTIKSSSNKGKNVVVDISSCIQEFFKPSASDWMSSSTLFSCENISRYNSCSSFNRNENKDGELCSFLIPDNNSTEFSNNDMVTVTIKSSLNDNHVKHLISSLTPIINTLNILLPSWFPNYYSDVNRNSLSSTLFESKDNEFTSLGKANGVGSHSNSCINISEIDMFTEIRSFLLKTIEILKITDLFIKTYPFGIKYNAYITNENLICITYLDILKKSISNFNLFDLIENRGHQFLIRLIFRYDLLSASRFLNEYSSETPFLSSSSSSSSSKTKEENGEGILPVDIISIENSMSQLNKIIVFMKRNGSKQNFQGYVGSVQPHKANLLSEKVYHVPLNVSLVLLSHLEEYRTIMNLISFQSEYLRITGLFPLWLTNGEKVPIKIPTSLSEYLDYISKSNSFIQYFLEMLISEIRRSGQQYCSQIIPFSDIILTVEQSGCKTLLDYCRQNIDSNTTKSIYTYQFHTILWIYNNLQYLLDLKYNTYVLEIENFLSNMDLFDDEYFEYLNDFTIARKTNNYIENSKTGGKYNINSILNKKDMEKSIDERIDIFNEFREKILNIKSSITKIIILALKQEDNLGTKSKSSNKRIEISNNEWLHYYLFSYISYTDACMQKTIYEEIKNRKNRNPKFENWFTKNICITVFLFSDDSPFLKNWLENYNINDFYIKKDEINNSNTLVALKSTKNTDTYNKKTSGFKEMRNEKENDLINDQGYLLYNAKQYLSAGKHYYTKAKTFWKIPVKINSNLENKIYDDIGNYSDSSKESIVLINGCNFENVKYLGEYLKNNINNIRRILNTSMLIMERGDKKINDIYNLFIDIVEQILKMQQEPTLLQRKSLLLQSQTCIERDMDEVKNKDLIKNIRNDLFNIETQMEILNHIIEYIHYYILSALEQNVIINPTVKELFELFGTLNNKGFIKNENNSIMIDKKNLENEIISILNNGNNVSREGIDVFKYLILGIFNIQSMVHGNDTLLEFMTEFYNLTGFSSLTEIKWIIESSKGNSDMGIYNILGNKISSLFEFRIKQAYFFETPIFFEMDIVSILHFSESYVSYGAAREDSFKFSPQTFDSVIETVTLELFRFSILYYNEFRKNDLVDIYNFDDFGNVKSRVLWWVWPVKFIIFHLNNKTLISRLLPLFSGNSNNSSALFSIIGNNERIELSQIIKDSLSNNESNIVF
ncbi:hypothetical protein FG379_000820 [Cryptosporidium bovis]|uniref:uncharacterized protein n=1 Tax=Cryptosporidium bovis TaxID=310047 RepID=UPI00351A4568|nr:hypothetical protein FG379_000820 [Cryptosporidium bovis]